MIDRSRGFAAQTKFFTLKKRGHNPVKTVQDALTTSLKTGQLPPLSQKITSIR